MSRQDTDSLHRSAQSESDHRMTCLVIGRCDEARRGLRFDGDAHRLWDYFLDVCQWRWNAKGSGVFFHRSLTLRVVHFLAECPTRRVRLRAFQIASQSATLTTIRRLPSGVQQGLLLLRVASWPLSNLGGSSALGLNSYN